MRTRARSRRRATFRQSGDLQSCGTVSFIDGSGPGAGNGNGNGDNGDNGGGGGDQPFTIAGYPGLYVIGGLAIVGAGAYAVTRD